jgi:hypothetical protein
MREVSEPPRRGPTSRERRAIWGRRLGYGLATAAFLAAVILIIASITTL